mgnify:CR=1 FL=1
MTSEVETHAPDQPAAKHLLINRNFALLWSGQSLSSLGDVIFEITLTVWIGSELAAGESWAALAVAALLVASAIPVLLVGPIAGALVDRQPDKRRLLLRAELISAALILVFIPAAGDYINAYYLGSAKTSMIGTVVQDQFLKQQDYPQAAALSMVLMVIITVMVLIYSKFMGTEGLAV